MNIEIVGAKQNVAKQISDENQVSLADSIIIKLETLSSSNTTPCSIYRVHEKFRKQNESAYTPEMISIGPFHRGKSSLAAMEDQKLRYGKSLLSRTTPTGINKVEECVAYIEVIEHVARKCYSEPIHLNSREFVEMMVIDGLFITELFRKNADKVVKIERGDLIFDNTWGLSSLVRDLLLLENQIPMAVLERLLEVPIIKEQLNGVPIHILALRFFDPWMPQGKKTTESSFSSQGKHLLDLVSKTFHALPPKDSNADDKIQINSGKPIRSVTELKHAGVKFVKRCTYGSYLDIKYKDGIMEIPPIHIQDQTDTLLRNFIAFEQCGTGHITYITSYAFFMDSLINSGQDVRALCKEGIITNLLGDDEVVAALFNKLCSEVTLTNSYYSDLCDQVNTYYNTPWHVWRATLKRDYFSSPWAYISFVGAIVLLVLTFLATLYAILAYKQNSSAPSPGRPEN